MLNKNSDMNVQNIQLCFKVTGLFFYSSHILSQRQFEGARGQQSTMASSEENVGENVDKQTNTQSLHTVD